MFIFLNGSWDFIDNWKFLEPMKFLLSLPTLIKNNYNQRLWYFLSAIHQCPYLRSEGVYHAKKIWKTNTTQSERSKSNRKIVKIEYKLMHLVCTITYDRWLFGLIQALQSNMAALN